MIHVYLKHVEMDAIPSGSLLDFIPRSAVGTSAVAFVRVRNERWAKFTALLLTWLYCRPLAAGTMNL